MKDKMEDFSITVAFLSIVVGLFLLIIYLNKETFMDNLSTIQSIVIPKYYSNEIPFYEGTVEENVENFGGKRRNF